MFLRAFIFSKLGVPILQKLFSQGLPQLFASLGVTKGGVCAPAFRDQVAFYAPSSPFLKLFYIQSSFILSLYILFRKLDTVQLKRHLVIYSIHIHEPPLVV